MKIEVTSVSPVKKNLTLEAPADLVERERAEVVREYARRANIPGFRKGHVPADLVRKRFAREVADDLKERLANQLYRQAVNDQGLQPIGNPVVEEMELEDGQPFRMKASFEVLPDFEPVNYRGVEVRRPAAQVEDAEVSSAIEELRQARAQLVSEEGRIAATGDIVVADVRGKPEGEEEFLREGILIEIGAPNNLPEFNDQLEGTRSGVEKTFTVSYPEEYEEPKLAGREVAYEINVRDVKRREIPALDDDFAKDLGEFGDLAELEARVREDLLHRKKHQAEQAVRESVMDKVLLENAVPLPESLVEDEVRHRMEETVRAMFQQGMDPRTVDFDWNQLKERQQEGARKAVHARILLDRVATAEEIRVDDSDMDERIAAEARRMDESPDKLKATLRKDHRLEALRSQLVREKSLDFLVSVANIQSEE